MGQVAVVMLAIGLGTFMVGMLFKIQHWPFAGLLLLASYFLLAFGGALFALAVIKNKGLTGTLDPSSRDEDPD